MPRLIEKFQCDFCRRSYMRKKAAFNHEASCFHNPNRTPRKGELAIFDTIPQKLLDQDSYGVPGSDFVYLTTHQETIDKYPWWPTEDDGGLALGFIWSGNGWEAMNGYIDPHFAPGLSFKPEFVPIEYVMK